MGTRGNLFYDKLLHDELQAESDTELKKSLIVSFPISPVNYSL